MAPFYLVPNPRNTHLEQIARLSEASAIEEVYPYRFIRQAQRV